MKIFANKRSENNFAIIFKEVEVAITTGLGGRESHTRVSNKSCKGFSRAQSWGVEGTFWFDFLPRCKI